jgi:hypothetical protein
VKKWRIEMGQSKRNPTAILAKAGKLPPKDKKVGAKEQWRRVYREAEKIVLGKIKENKQNE